MWKVRMLFLFSYSVFVLFIKVSMYIIFSNFLHSCYIENTYMQIFELNSFSYKEIQLNVFL
jgi:hypothetical protein